MSPTAQNRTIPLEVAEIAVEVQRIAGEQRLLDSQVGQNIQMLTTLVHDVQAEQMRAREDRLEQKEKLSTLLERSSAVSTAASRVQELEHRLSYWRGIVVGFAALATVVAGLSVAWITDQFQVATRERARLEQRIEYVERKR